MVWQIIRVSLTNQGFARYKSRRKSNTTWHKKKMLNIDFQRKWWKKIICKTALSIPQKRGNATKREQGSFTTATPLDTYLHWPGRDIGRRACNVPLSAWRRGRLALWPLWAPLPRASKHKQGFPRASVWKPLRHPEGSCASSSCWTGVSAKTPQRFALLYR